MKRKRNRKNSNKNHLVIPGVFILFFLFILGFNFLGGCDKKSNQDNQSVIDTNVEKVLRNNEKKK